MRSATSTAATTVYAMAELHELRRSVVKRARTCPPGSERNQQRQIGRSIKRLLGERVWLTDHVSGVPGDAVRMCALCAKPMTHLADLRSFGPRPAERIHRCYTCNHVTSELR